MKTHLRWIPVAITFALIAAMLLHGPISQPDHYHAFADTRIVAGIGNGADVLSNLGFAVVAVVGLITLWPRRHTPQLSAGWPGYALFVVALLLTTVGSGYYHLAPDNARLFWDRLPIALACAGLLAGVRAQLLELPTRDSAISTIGIATAAVLSVGWWWFTERLGAGDLRPYLLIQGLPLVLIPIWQAIYRAPRGQRIAFAIAIGLYIVAKVLEVADHQVLGHLSIVSGHTLKHLFAAAASGVIVSSLIQQARVGKE